MKKLLLKKLSGSMYVETVINILIFVIILVFVIIILPVFIFKANLNTYADKVLRVAELSGSISSSEVRQKISSMEEATGIHPENISWSGSDSTGDGRVQLGREISITITASYKVTMSIFGDFYVPLSGKARGSSEIYWK